MRECKGFENTYTFVRKRKVFGGNSILLQENAKFIGGTQYFCERMLIVLWERTRTRTRFGLSKEDVQVWQPDAVSRSPLREPGCMHNLRRSLSSEINAAS